MTREAHTTFRLIVGTNGQQSRAAAGDNLSLHDYPE
jgi:hypothetical protein